MKWIITEDHINGPDNPKTDRPVVMTLPGIGCPVGRHPGGKFMTVGEITVYSNELPCEFQLLDDDDNLYFVGRCSDLSQQDANSAFEPLDRLGAAYGCTTMMYRPAGDPLAAWEQL